MKLVREQANGITRLGVVTAYAAAMAWVESAVVFYLRTMINRIEPYQPNPLPVVGSLGMVELAREAATLIMLLTVGILAGRNWRSRLGYTAIAFGVWDICYYAFLKVMCGWPHSVWDWDILFLLPLPWWGPVIAPVSIALLMIFWGLLASQFDVQAPKLSSEWKPWALNFAGILLALYVFMLDSIRVAHQGVEVLRNVLPGRFEWPLFVIALLLMAAPIVSVLRQLRQRAFDIPPGLDCNRWISHFARNREHRDQPDWSAPFSVPPKALPPLIRSLEQFQLGDGGGPASLIARDADRFRNATPEMRKLVDLWFEEEKEHSRLLGCAVDRIGGKRIQSHWSFSAFCQCRRILGVRFELQVLLLTEITSTAYYRLLQRHSPIAALKVMCGLILRDEGGHVAFHLDRHKSAGRSSRAFAGWFWSVQFRACGYAAATMLWVNHRPALVALGATTPEFYREVQTEIEHFLRALSKHSEAPVENQRSVLAGNAQPECVGK